MNLNKIRPKIDTEGLLLSITIKCETLIEQTHKEAEETLEFKLIKPKGTFHLIPPIQIKRYWMIGVIRMVAYNSFFNINKTNNNFELYTEFFDEFSFEELEDELEEILSISDITTYHLHHEKLGPRNIETYRKVRLENSSSDGYIIFLMGYARSPFRDFESFFRVVFGLDEDDLPLILEQFTSNFINYELPPGIYTIKDIS